MHETDLSVSRFFVGATPHERKLFKKRSPKPFVALTFARHIHEDEELEAIALGMSLFSEWILVSDTIAIRNFHLEQKHLEGTGYKLELLPHQQVPTQFRNRVF